MNASEKRCKESSLLSINTLLMNINGSLPNKRRNTVITLKPIPPQDPPEATIEFTIVETGTVVGRER